MVFFKSAKNTFEKIFLARARNSLIDFDDDQIFSYWQLATLVTLVEKGLIVQFVGSLSIGS